MFLVGGAGTGYAAVCSACHTMHNSQGGSAMGGTDDAQSMLLLNDCLGCHTGTNDGGDTPYVYNSGGATYGTDTLAGGDFCWAVDDATTGHNVTGIGSINLSTPPGYDGGRMDSLGETPGQGTWDTDTNPLTCAGAYGCHGKHDSGFDDMAGVNGAHHSNEGGSLTTAGTSGNSYRFLIGIHGYEETKWEYAPSSSEHNQYKGVTRAGTVDTKTTISWLCGECHGEYHTDAADVGSASPWLRHPTDLSLNDVTGTEYASYNNSNDPAAATYSIIAPVASTDVSAILGSVNVTKDNAADNAIVTCLSCHRAHGSPYSDMLRWEYTMDAGSGSSNDGCFICHTTKDDA